MFLLSLTTPYHVRGIFITGLHEQEKKLFIKKAGFMPALEEPPKKTFLLFYFGINTLLMT